VGDSAGQDLDRGHPPDRRTRSCAPHARRAMGLVKEPRASTNRGGSNVSFEGGIHFTAPKHQEAVPLPHPLWRRRPL